MVNLTDEELAKKLGIPLKAKVEYNIKEEFPNLHLAQILHKAKISGLAQFCIKYISELTKKPIDELEKEVQELVYGDAEILFKDYYQKYQTTKNPNSE